ncbi:putative cardiolipin synthetase [Cercophora samala]|uniref:Cardiolipin synthetase n=1 Tax=Cercophora samala TaxID=330535 RepID=A0AA39ZMY6_9PEZI|nr:putative cardiolipin synthetase [Cercophora samala]
MISCFRGLPLPRGGAAVVVAAVAGGRLSLPTTSLAASSLAVRGLSTIPSSHRRVSSVLSQPPPPFSPQTSPHRHHQHRHHRQPPINSQFRTFTMSTPPLRTKESKIPKILHPSTLSKKLQSKLPAAIVPKKENIYTIPNILTFSRILSSPFIGYAILHDQHALALGLFAYAGVSDALDGWIARRWKLQTVVGTVIDPMADKMLMTVLVVALGVKGLLPVWLAVLILGRDVALAMSAIYYRWISLPPPKTMARYWDFSLPSAEVRPTVISKFNTFLQLGLMGLTTLAPVVTSVDFGPSLTVLQYVVATTTVWSGASYVYSKDAVKILTQPEKKQEKEVVVGEEGKKREL